MHADLTGTYLKPVIANPDQFINRLGLVRSPYDQETRQQAVRLYFEELADGTSSKAAALRAV
ncbi:hypothetical protein FRC0418_02035 [Corynebacterium diphtheriae]|nr:hypothetical protein CIP107518_02119 [Corynebacterium diphtheriae]CAB0613698.1 hypothetical protein CIP107536_01817 [Corynebacterium diphtheriae]CAB0667157.1 hypothetical protein CIP107582_02147 [Corynebacterium diphtheriae]CAB0761416.1 hypothetical protein FRC0132_02022 [Corynebacterium diphtheriae]CAB0818846.1 hypothetical protein FRC0263_02217 [Corynebacterium diphtheriae]